jgi:hypothetical protein
MTNMPMHALNTPEARRLAVVMVIALASGLGFLQTVLREWTLFDVARSSLCVGASSVRPTAKPVPTLPPPKKPDEM